VGIGSIGNLAFVIANKGVGELSGLSVTVAGPDSAAFSVASPPAQTLDGPSAKASFVVAFAPVSLGDKAADMLLFSNDKPRSPYRIRLTGRGLSKSEAWRLKHFGTTDSTGDAADAANPTHDGIPNLIKFATGMDPTRPGRNPTSQAARGAEILFSYSRSKAAASEGVTYAVEWSDDLSRYHWSGLGVAETVEDQGTVELVTAIVPVGPAGRRFVRLRISR
jgi:hypothetical protein